MLPPGVVGEQGAAPQSGHGPSSCVKKRPSAGLTLVTVSRLSLTSRACRPAGARRAARPASETPASPAPCE
jgi:hypothetical protein